MKKNKHLNILLVIIVIFSEQGFSQLSGFIRFGINAGTINKDSWTLPNTGETHKYNKALLRPILGVGAQYRVSKNFMLRQELFFQTKGQGTLRPDTWSLFNTYNKDILRFMSFPFSIHYRIVSQLYMGVAFQPSLYISGSDNYSASEYWKGWVYGGTASVHGIIKKKYELGFEYDRDFTLYYCVGCDEQFYTFRLYGLYHFFDDHSSSIHSGNSGSNK